MIIRKTTLYVVSVCVGYSLLCEKISKCFLIYNYFYLIEKKKNYMVVVVLDRQTGRWENGRTDRL